MSVTFAADRSLRTTASAARETVPARRRTIQVTGHGSCGPVRARWPDERAAAGGRPGGEQGPPRAGQLSGVRDGQRPDRGGQRGDLRGQTDLGVHRRTPDPDQAGRGKGGLVSALQAEFTAEVTRLAELAAGSLGTDGAQGLAAVELAIRTAMTKLGASLLEGLLGLDSGHRGPRIDCG